MIVTMGGGVAPEPAPPSGNDVHLWETMKLAVTDPNARKELFAVCGTCLMGVGALYAGAAMRMAGWL